MKKELRELLNQIETKKGEVRSFLDGNKIEEAKKASEQLTELRNKFNVLQMLEDDEEEDPEQRGFKNIKNTRNKEQQLDFESRSIIKFLSNEKLGEEERNSFNTENGNAILPTGFYSEIQHLRKGYTALKDYCHVIPVTTLSGSMPISKGSTSKKLAKLQKDKEMIKDMINVEPVKYAVEDYGKIIPVDNDLFDDAGVEVLKGLVNPALSEDAVNTENAEIIALVKGATEETKQIIIGKDYKDIKKIINTKIPPSLKSGLIIITNQSGYNYLDNLEDKNGRPLLVESLKEGEPDKFKGKPVVYFDDEDIVNEEGKASFYVVNLYALAKFWDRKKYEIGISKEAGFTYNQTLVKIIERFDLSKADTRACFKVLIPVEP